MSLKQLVEGDCGGVNPLMQLGQQFTRDAARRDEGFMQPGFERRMHPNEQMVNEFLGHVTAPPQSFQMETLIQEMREIEKGNTGAIAFNAAPRVIDEVTGQWAKEYTQGQSQMLHMQPQQQQITHVREFFETNPSSAMQMGYGSTTYRPYVPMLPPPQQQSFGPTAQFFEQCEAQEKAVEAQSKSIAGNWFDEYEQSKEQNEKASADYNENFWQHLQDEWQKLSDKTEHPWLSELDENYDPYKEYQFTEDNPMAQLENAFEKGLEYLSKGDIPSAVLCFEVAAQKDPENAEIWEHLGLTQAENEMDPQGIAALKRSLDIRSDNKRVLMALAICYTNESLQSQALKMITKWLQINPKYKHLIEQHPEFQAENEAIASSLIRGNKLVELQNVFLEAVRLNPSEIDPEVQEALGVLYNLSSEFDKAVDCFSAALFADPQNAKIWNRLGASLANGSRSVEAVEAYQHALQLQPGFIRVRYNVGVCCMNLKAYKQAAEHLLTALNMQANSAVLKELPAVASSVTSGQHQMSESIWSTLKMVISLMGRYDLQDAVNNRNLDILNDAFKE
ncbi:peroxisomal targeting signal 1 receptor [Teleopsis dalmanni]|uniref:peroxisomal targeting signal 1 receptor n=1 Tax=Teleopsis dalmanni TaxID=139649 RepID=UPI0018CD07E7|nr:peroxisomal targeting signal 1 receptor [Teleopsis dalmanni]